MISEANGNVAEKNLVKLGYGLPPFPKPATAAYIPYTTVGDLLYISGQLPLKRNGSLHVGKVTPQASSEGEVNLEAGKEAAQACALTMLSLLREALGSLDRVVRFVKTTVMVNCSGDFEEPQVVANGFSQTMIDVFGEPGRCARSAIGHATLPFGATVEVEAIVQIQLAPKL